MKLEMRTRVFDYVILYMVNSEFVFFAMLSAAFSNALRREHKESDIYFFRTWQIKTARGAVSDCLG